MAATTTCRDDLPWDATTTMGEVLSSPSSPRTMWPERYPSARLRAVRIGGSPPCYIAWTQVRELHGIKFTVGYDLELALPEEGPTDEFAQVASMTVGKTNPGSVLTSDSVASGGASQSGTAHWRIITEFATATNLREPRTALWRRLMEIRNRAITTGMPLLGWRELEDEMKSRRVRDLPGDDL